MSTHADDPFGDPSLGHRPHDLPPIEADTDRIETEFFVLEPTLRDANRSLRDLLGPCPWSNDGNWMWLDHDGRAVLHGGIDGMRGLADKCRRLAVLDLDARPEQRPVNSLDGTYWVSGALTYECDAPSSPHLPTGARLRRHDSREG